MVRASSKLHAWRRVKGALSSTSDCRSETVAVIEERSVVSCEATWSNGASTGGEEGGLARWARLRLPSVDVGGACVVGVGSIRVVARGVARKGGQCVDGGVGVVLMSASNAGARRGCCAGKACVIVAAEVESSRPGGGEAWEGRACVCSDEPCECGSGACPNSGVLCGSGC